ncbi:MAG: ABC transporter transmembrane domain-containing protein, partial [Defluviitaleaceae bacterium]|nr:ABC transporter transmembrane domain-containing protein [Defluviitaleaceae bacterium]
MKVFKFCNKYILKYKFSILIYVLLTLIITAISIASPYITGSFLDNLIAGGSLEVVIRFCIIFGSLSLSKILLGYATSLLYIKTQANLSYEINRDTIEHIQNLSLSFIQNSDAAGLNQKVNYDASRVITFCISILQNVIVNVGMFLAPFIILLRINWFVAIILIVFLALYIT